MNAANSDCSCKGRQFAMCGSCFHRLLKGQTVMAPPLVRLRLQAERSEKQGAAWKALAMAYKAKAEALERGNRQQAQWADHKVSTANTTLLSLGAI